MKKMLVVTTFMLAMLAWAAAQQSPTTQDPNSGQPTSPSSQTPGGAGQSQPSTPEGADQPGSRGQAANAPVTQGCLGGSNPNYTITDSAGTTYKLNIPANADTSKLAPHVGESVQVAGNVNDAGKTGSASIDVQGIGTGTGKCPGNGSKDAQSRPKQ